MSLNSLIIPWLRRKAALWSLSMKLRVTAQLSGWQKNSCGWFGLFFSFISWRLITLQYCSGFCHTLTWISHGFTCIPHPDPPSSLPPHPIPLGLPSAPALSTCLMHPTWAGDLFHPWQYTCFNAIFSEHPTLAFSHRIQKSVLYICVSFSVLHIGLFYHLSKFHIYVLVYCIGVYLSGLLHSV